jgi:thiamine-monophosphate kinase
MDTKKTKPQLFSQTAASLGEHRIIELMRCFFDVMPNMPVPFGDDVSAVPVDKGDVAVLKTDMLVAKTDVPFGMNLWQAARKAVVMNVSDFAAKGVAPKAVLTSLGLPENLTRNQLEKIAKGLNAGAREYGAYVVGGDTGEATDLVIAVQLFGVARKNALMLRSGAKPGDILAVTGLFGKSAAGLKLLLNKKCQASGVERDVLLDAVYMPYAHLQEGLALGRSGAVTASIDSSDGLGWCLHEIAKQSGVGFVVFKLPVATEAKLFAEANCADACKLALYGGEEYELVVTVNPNMWADAEAAVASAGGKLLPIGEATKEKQVLLNVEDVKLEIEARGYEHFKGN